MPRQTTHTGIRADWLFHDELIRRAPMLTPAAERELAESSRFRGPVTLFSGRSDAADIIRYRIPEEQILIREALDASREAFARHHRMETHESPTNDRIHVAARWSMRLHEQDGKVFAVCYRFSGGRYTAYSIDPAKSRSAGTVCYSTGSAEPMNGKPREEFETWALEELEKLLRAEERPPF